MALDLEIIVRERESGVVTERFVQLSLTPKELGNVHRLEAALNAGFDLEIINPEDY